MMRLHGYFRSSAAYRCRIALNLKGLAYEQASVHLRRGEQRSESYKRLNPQALVPALETDAGVFTQSLAIIEWLDETYPKPALLPADPAQRAQVRAFALAIAADIHPLNNLRVLNFLQTDMGADEARLDAWRRRWIVDGFDACEAWLARRSTHSTFCFGDTPGLADVCLAPQVYSAERFNVDMKQWPLLSAVHAACEALPTFADAHPQKQTDNDL